MTSEYDILLFNAFVVWVNAGVFTQIILTRKQQERDEHMLKICSSMKNPDYNLNKKLTIRRIEHWDMNVFIPIAMDLFSSMPGYMKEAMKKCEDPFQMHGQLILGASLLLYQCVMVGGMCSRTMEAIESWFCLLGHLEDSKLFCSLELDHQDEIQNIARKYIDVSNNKKGTTRKTKQFPHFSPRALFISHAHLVHMMFFKKSHAKYEKWSMLSGLSLPTLLGIKPNVDGIIAPFPYLGSTSLSIEDKFHSCNPIPAKEIFTCALKKITTRNHIINAQTGAMCDPDEQMQMLLLGDKLCAAVKISSAQMLRNERAMRFYMNKSVKDCKMYSPRDEFSQLRDFKYIDGGMFQVTYSVNGDRTSAQELSQDLWTA
jgi:hypothetical protein